MSDPVTPRARLDRAMFHVKHRAVATAALLAAGLIAAGCAAGTAPAPGWAPPVAAPDGMLIVQSGVGRIAAVNAGDGSRVGEFELKGPMSRDFLGRNRQEAPAPLYAAPLVQSDAVYIASYRGRVARLRFANGVFTPAWEVDLDENVVATPALRGNRLHVFAENGRVFTLDAANGATISSTRPTDGRVWGAPELAENRLYIGTLDSSELVAINADTGAIEWRQGLAGATAADPVIDGDLLVLASFDRTVHALGLADGGERWRFQGDGWFVGRPLVTRQGVYAGTMRGSVYALDRAGQLRWKFTREGLEFRAALVLVGDTLVAAARNGTIVGLDAATGAERWTRTAEGVSIDANGLLLESGLFYLSAGRRLLRVDPASGTIQGFDIKPSDGK